MRGAIAALALTLICAAGAGGQASAKKHKPKKHRHPAITMVTDTKPGGPELTNVTATATCPGGTRVIGGGFSATAPDSIQALLVSSSRAVLPSAWQVRATQDASAGNAGSLTAQAFCEKPLKPKAKKGRHGKKKRRIAPITEISADGQIGGGEVGSATATCPGTQQALSGGFSIPSLASTGDFVLPAESRRSAPNTWRAAGWSQGGPPVTVTSFAYCGAETTVEGAVSASVAPSAGSNGGVVSPQCPGGSKLAAAGFSSAPVPGPGGNLPFIYEAGAVDSLAARTSAQQLGTSASPLTVAGYCL